MQLFNNASALRTVLYVEDDEFSVLLMRSLFERRPDLRLQVATGCAEALHCVQAQPLALLLLDLRLPDGHGCELLPRLRAQPGLRDLPALAVTAEYLPALDLHGFDELWPKPLQLLQVLDRLDHWLPLHRVQVQGPVPPPAAVSSRQAGGGPPVGMLMC